MAISLKEALRKVAAEIEDAENAEEREKERQRLEALEKRALSDEDKAALARVHAMLAELDKEDAEEEASNGSGASKTEKPASTDEEVSEQKPPKKKVRPGRKSGEAYDWYVDDDGKVTRSDVAVVYTGADEPEEVEIT